MFLLLPTTILFLILDCFPYNLSHMWIWIAIKSLYLVVDKRKICLSLQLHETRLENAKTKAWFFELNYMERWVCEIGWSQTRLLSHLSPLWASIEYYRIDPTVRQWFSQRKLLPVQHPTSMDEGWKSEGESGDGDSKHTKSNDESKT